MNCFQLSVCLCIPGPDECAVLGVERVIFKVHGALHREPRVHVVAHVAVLEHLHPVEWIQDIVRLEVHDLVQKQIRSPEVFICKPIYSLSRTF